MKAAIVFIFAVLLQQDLGSCTEDTKEMFLTFQNASADCVNPRYPYETYCLSWKRSFWTLARERGYKCYLKQKLVYECTPTSHCTDYGILMGNTRPSEASEDCPGLPFANIIDDTFGNFICIIEDNERRIQASFNLTICEENVNDFKVELILENQGKTLTCIDQMNRTGYCLSSRLNGLPVHNKDFKLYLDNYLVYRCMANGTCQGSGKLKNITQSFTTTEECMGIQFDHFQQNFIGTYTVDIEDPVHLLLATYGVHYCKDANSDNQQTDWWIYALIGVLCALCIVAIVGAIIYYREKHPRTMMSTPAQRTAEVIPLDRSSDSENIPAEGVPLAT